MISFARFITLIAALLCMVGCASIVKPTAVVHNDATTTIRPVMEVVVENTKPTLEPPPVLVVDTDSLYSDQDLTCMTEVMLYEARGEGQRGMAAVGYVVLNRTQTKGYPKTVCGVVYEKRYVKGRARCQFNWHCDKPKTAFTSSDRELARTIAVSVLTREYANPVGNAVFFHERRLRPSFAKSSNYVGSVGNHRFYSAL